jgi:hypothetical protein
VLQRQPPELQEFCPDPAESSPLCRAIAKAAESRSAYVRDPDGNRVCTYRFAPA